VKSDAIRTSSPSRDDQSTLPVTVLIAARNEEHNISECLRSVQWADEVYVVDSHSTDRTTEVAERFGAKCVQFDYDGGWPKKRNWAIQNLPIQSPWLLVLDADERVSADLRNEIASAIQSTDRVGYYMRWKFVFLGTWMKHSWSDVWILRLFRLGYGQYEDLGMRGEGGWDTEVHENIVVSGPVGFLKGHLLHESRQTVSGWICKQNEFSDWNAARRIQQLQEPIPRLSKAVFRDPVARRKWMKAVFLRLPFKPALVFLYLYVFKLGFLDGLPGAYFCLLRAMHELNTCVKVYELRRSGRSGESPDQGSAAPPC